MSAQGRKLRKLACWTTVVLGALVHSGSALAQDAPAGSARPDLERRVQELEETVRQLHGVSPPSPLPANTPIAPTLYEVDGQAFRLPTPGIASAPTDGAMNPPGATEGGRGINLERERLGEDAGRSPSRGLPPGEVAGWSNGFYLQSRDQALVLRLTGQIQGDYHAYLRDFDTTDVDTFLIRRARLGLEATLYDAFEFRLMPDFGQGQTRLQDAYVNVRYWDAGQLQVGKFKQPFSYEQLVQDRYVPTLERSLIDQLVPQRDVGVMAHGDVLEERLEYGLAFSNGQTNGDVDLNGNKDLNARLSVRPFRGFAEDSALRYLQLGMSGGFGEQNAPVQPPTLTTPLGVRWLQFNSTVQAYGMRNRFSPELSYFLGPLGFAGQYFHEDEELLPSVTGKGSKVRLDVPANGFYVMTTLLLTGETRTGYSQAIAPLRMFDPAHPLVNPGAWELVARVSRLQLGDGVFAPGSLRLVDPARYSSGATEMTIGFNWYLNRFVRMQLNWEHSWFDDPVQFGAGPSSRLSQQDALGTRMQIIF